MVGVVAACHILRQPSCHHLGFGRRRSAVPSIDLVQVALSFVHQARLLVVQLRVSPVLLPNDQEVRLVLLLLVCIRAVADHQSSEGLPVRDT